MENDFATASRELRVRKSPNYDAVCFHAQQCAEKYLKARLQEASIAFGKTHDLAALLDLLVSIEPAWDAMRSDLRTLGAFAVAFRYPGESADRETARDAVAICRDVRRVVRGSLGLQVG